ncbi:Gamma-aminobutyric acid receptor-associated protein-like 1 [Portunus trituberculatus]|uniref:Gamma-aminobutyric acid receptor-associated protein-like 1 n=1 Tax=Portunus trituberculatus TaxID=210409 RepID=A0A5B7I1B6_PORTR|nr:Gamma-aminobutyric acid receptor-associated protein-like 1 [Portunus trituberculatus]
MRVSAPGHLNLAQLHLALRTRIEVDPRHSILFFTGNTLASVTCTLASLHHAHAHTDHFLYVTFCEENFQG